MNGVLCRARNLSRDNTPAETNSVPARLGVAAGKNRTWLESLIFHSLCVLVDCNPGPKAQVSWVDIFSCGHMSALCVHRVVPSQFRHSVLETFTLYCELSSASGCAPELSYLRL
jgi:hypothetical protein